MQTHNEKAAMGGESQAADATILKTNYNTIIKTLLQLYWTAWAIFLLCCIGGLL